MERPILLLGAPSNLGLAPTDDGALRSVDLAPAVYRELGLVRRLGARDLGDVIPPPYADFELLPGGVRNVGEISAHARSLADAVAASAQEGGFLLVAGGDCSIVLGVLLGLKARGRCGLVYIDGHNDFSVPETSWSGGVAGMDLAIAVGLGDGALTRLGGPHPLVRGEDVVVLGRKDLPDDLPTEVPALTHHSITDLPHAAIRHHPPASVIADVLARVTGEDLAGFWIHVDVDVVDPDEVPAVDSPEPGGLTLDALAELLTPLAHHPRALGLDVTIYDPGLDPDRRCGARIVDLLQRVLAPTVRAAIPAGNPSAPLAN